MPGPIHFLVLLAIVVVAMSARSKRMMRVSTGMAIVAFCWAWIFSTPMFASLLLANLEGSPISEHNAMSRADSLNDGRTVYLVLGSGHPAAGTADRHARLTHAGLQRVHTAAAAWKRTGGVMVMAGGLGLPDAANERSVASAMRRVAVTLGVSPQAIQTSGHTAVNTREDIAAGLTAIGNTTDPIVLVTSAAHMPRSLAVARKLGASPVPLPCDYRQLQRPSWRAWFPSHHGPALWEHALHEIIGLAVYRWRGWAQ